jgi:hypothetical protein
MLGDFPYFTHPHLIVLSSSLRGNNSISLASSTLIALSYPIRERWLAVTTMENILVMRAPVAVAGHRRSTG